MERVIIITGIKRIGDRIARHLLGQGYSLTVVYKGSQAQADHLKEIGKDRVLPIKADLYEESACIEVVRKTHNTFGRIDGFIHLASPYMPIEVEEVSTSDLEFYMRPITYAFFLISKEAYPYMMRNPGSVKGRIIAFGDWAISHTPYRHYSPYFIAKGALHSAVKTLAKEFSPHVLVNCIAPGPVMIPEGMEKNKWERILSGTPLKREVSIEDILSLTDFLLRAESITGEIIHLDSGRHIAGSGS
jgi:NAD(P)-dependent dehydrogenase (short-subunit alcohol dehydrogenase family)